MMVARTIALPWSALWVLANRNGWLGKFEIGTSPHLAPAALDRWRAALALSNTYLEYGSGGSTVEAVNSKVRVISVESDGHYLQLVEKKVEQVAGSSNAFHPLHADIGITEKWGRPLLPWPSRIRLARWRSYTSAPWTLINEIKAIPDFIFVDGRFRAACVLESFLQLPADANCQFMLDDFENRQDHYRPVLAFATDIELVGRAVMFRRDPKFDRAVAQALLAKAQANPE